jgi:hypothetical protein
MALGVASAEQPRDVLVRYFLVSKKEIPRLGENESGI